jgi:hypothetical protein
MTILGSLLDFLAYYDSRLKAHKTMNLSLAQKKKLYEYAHKAIYKNFEGCLNHVKFLLENSTGVEYDSLVSEQDKIQKMFAYYKQHKTLK